MNEGFRDSGENEKPCGKPTGYRNARKNFHYIRSLAARSPDVSGLGMRSLSVSKPGVFSVRG
jgi:hypothetical protein